MFMHDVVGNNFPESPAESRLELLLIHASLSGFSMISKSHIFKPPPFFSPIIVFFFILGGFSPK